MARRAEETKPEWAGSPWEELLEFVPDAIVGVREGGEIALLNSRSEDLFGYRRDELLGRTLETLVPERFRVTHQRHRESFFDRPSSRPMHTGMELRALHKDGTELSVEISLGSVQLGGERIATAAIRDISERAESERERALQQQLDRARRLESVGQLAGGIAHDFNNTLGVIINYAAFVAEQLEEGSPAHQDVDEIRRAAERAANLTRQLLIFSRREVAKPEIIDLSDLMAEVENLLRRALGERVELVVRIAEDVSPIEADPGQIEQVLLNIAVNARDAMPEGGRLLLEADNVTLDREYAYMHPEAEPGRYVRLKATDEGTGMDQETLDKAFEPFFTTKGDGTGLGLATAYGIVQGAGGHIDIYSEPGIGTAVKIHLPVASEEAHTDESAAARAVRGDGEVVLVVEDEPEVRRMAERILSDGGFTVMAAEGGAEAVKACERPDQRIDLLLTDVIMPGMLGPELAERARERRPDIPVLYMSGYSHSLMDPRALSSDRSTGFIEKPFNASALLDAVRELLDRPHRDGERGGPATR